MFKFMIDLYKLNFIKLDLVARPTLALPELISNKFDVYMLNLNSLNNHKVNPTVLVQVQI